MINQCLAGAVLEIIRTGRSGGSDFEAAEFKNLAVAIASEQGLVRKGHPLTEKLQGLDQIDPLPETAFKITTIAQFPPSEAEAEFLTSGTTAREHGRLLVRDMSVYRESAVNGFRMFCMYDQAPRRFLSLIPSGRDRATSSLSWMASFLIDEFAPNTGIFACGSGDLQGDTILEVLKQTIEDDKPIFILGTSLDFLTLFTFLRGSNEVTRLPSGSRIMHTGGSKTSERELSGNQLIGEANLLLGIEPPDVIEEFGMTELFSQAYDSPRVTQGPRRLVTVPWMKTRVLDPRTMKDVADNERGILVHYDLAAFDTCVALMAADTALRVSDGFTDIRRAARATRPGCSSVAAKKTI